MKKFKIQITEDMVRDIYYYDSEIVDFKDIFIIFNEKIRLFLKDKNYNVEFIKKPTRRKLHNVDTCDGLKPIDTPPLRTLFFRTVGFSITFENEIDFATFKIKYA